MTMYTQTDIRPHEGSALGGIFANARAQYIRWRIYTRTRDELMSLGNRELADLGIDRSGVRAVALEAAYGEK